MFNIQQKLLSHSQLSAPIKEHDSTDHFSQVNIKTISKQGFGKRLPLLHIRTCKWFPTDLNAFDTSN